MQNCLNLDANLGGMVISMQILTEIFPPSVFYMLVKCPMLKIWQLVSGGFLMPIVNSFNLVHSGIGETCRMITILILKDLHHVLNQLHKFMHKEWILHFDKHSSFGILFRCGKSDKESIKRTSFLPL